MKNCMLKKKDRKKEYLPLEDLPLGPQIMDADDRHDRAKRRVAIIDENEKRLEELNNFDREEMTEDFSDSPFLKNL
jgi:hypothetical protein